MNKTVIGLIGNTIMMGVLIVGAFDITGPPYQEYAANAFNIWFVMYLIGILGAISSSNIPKKDVPSRIAAVYSCITATVVIVTTCMVGWWWTAIVVGIFYAFYSRYIIKAFETDKTKATEMFADKGQ